MAMKAWVLVALVAACGRDGGQNAVKEKTRAELTAAWGTKVKDRLDKVVAAAKAASAADLGAPGDAQLALDFVHREGKHPNAFAVQFDDVQSATEPRPPPPPPYNAAAEIESAMAEGRDPVFKRPRPPHPLFTFQADHDSHVSVAKDLLGVIAAGSGSADTANLRYGDEEMLEQFVNAKYVLVVTPTDVQWPELPSDDEFVPGKATLRAMLIEIDTAKPLGGFETTAQSSDKVRVLETADYDAVARKVDGDFLAEASTAVAKGIETRWPGAKAPASFGHTSY